MNLEHFVLKYLAVPKLPKADEKKKKIVCIGDSITFGAGVRGKKHQTWEFCLESKLGEEWQVLNYGISGRTLLSDGDYPYVHEKQYAASKGVCADKYIIMLGTNDSKPYNWKKDAYYEELVQFVEEYVSLENHPAVILMTPPSCYVDPKLGRIGFDIDGNLVASDIRSFVLEIGEKLGLKVIDLHSFTANHEEWFVDGVHPNQLGNEKIAEFIYESIAYMNQE